MKLEITKVTTAEQTDAVADLANKIWHEHFTPIIGLDQVNYMLEKFQSEKAIWSQLKNGSEYYIAEIDRQGIGYTCLVPDESENKIMISKIYLEKAYRGSGVGSQILDFIEQETVRRNLTILWLTVNRNNHGPINWYARKGFTVVDEVKKDIGNGYYMDDYIMQKSV